MCGCGWVSGCVCVCVCVCASVCVCVCVCVCACGVLNIIDFLIIRDKTENGSN